jgi:hypothetical protein
MNRFKQLIRLEKGELANKVQLHYLKSQLMFYNIKIMLLILDYQCKHYLH